MAQSAPASESPEKATPLIGYVTPHVHWDRAWYLPFQQYRYRLIEFVDELLELLENPESNYPSFEFDGQTVVLEDYLEVKPENRGRIEKLVKAGKLGVGPWYVLPDEFIVGGEALVRNLQFGHRIAEQFGGRSDIGYVPDPFGHVAQLPAILRGVGLDTFLFTRGAGKWVADAGCVFEWVAGDGETSVTAVKQTPDYPCLMAWGFEERQLDAKNSMDVNVDTAMGRLQRLIDGLDATYNWAPPVVQLGNGSDHTMPQPTLPMLIEAANKHFAGVIELRHARFGDFFDAIKQWAEAEEKSGRALTRYQGELHQGWDRALLSGVFSARLYLKRMNDSTMALLTHQIEPMAALAWGLGGRARPESLQLAWREVLRNHPHDDICGCSVDATHQDMEIRFRHAREIASMLTDDLTKELQPLFDLSHIDEDAVPFLIHNPLSVPWTGSVQVDSSVPNEGRWQSMPTARAILADGDGAILSNLEITKPEWGLHIHSDRVANVRLPKVRGAIEVSELQPGWHVLHLLPGIDTTPPPAQPVTTSGGEGGWWMENGLIRAIFREDGRFDLIDASTGKTYSGLGWLEDDEDAGDSYDHSPGGYAVAVGAGKDVGLDERPDHVGRRNLHEEGNHRSEVTITACHSDEWSATMQIRIEWLLPRNFNDDKQVRSEEDDWLSIEHWVTMRSGSPVLEVDTVVDNGIDDHRLRLILPTGIESDVVRAGGAFEMAERPWHFPHDSSWNQPEVPTKHMRNVVLVQDDVGGLALLAPGANEYEARLGDDGGLELCFTLLRSVGWLSRDGFAWRRNRAGPCFPAPGAQCHGHHFIRWGLLPFEGSWEDSQPTISDHGVHEYAESFGAQIVFIPGLPKPQLDGSFDPLPEPGKLGTRARTWYLEGEKPLPISSSCKPCENGDGFALRLWNPTSNDWHGVLASDLDLRIEPCDMLERPTQAPHLDADGRVRTSEDSERNGKNGITPNGEICVPAGGIATFTMR